MALDGWQPPQQALEIIVGHFHRVNRPVYLGAASLIVRWSLDRTQRMFDVLEDLNIIRPATDDEKAAEGMAPIAHVYVLVGAAAANKVRW